MACCRPGVSDLSEVRQIGAWKGHASDSRMPQPRCDSRGYKEHARLRRGVLDWFVAYSRIALRWSYCPAETLVVEPLLRVTVFRACRNTLTRTPNEPALMTTFKKNLASAIGKRPCQARSASTGALTIARPRTPTKKEVVSIQPSPAPQLLPDRIQVCP